MTYINGFQLLVRLATYRERETPSKYSTFKSYQSLDYYHLLAVPLLAGLLFGLERPVWTRYLGLYLAVGFVAVDGVVGVDETDWSSVQLQCEQVRPHWRHWSFVPFDCLPSPLWEYCCSATHC